MIIKSNKAVAPGWRLLTAAALMPAVLAQPASAQQAAGPSAPPASMTLQIPPLMQPLPVLTQAQIGQLTMLLGVDGMGQGRPAQAAPNAASGQESLVRVALDRARAVHSGSLDTADFEKDWGLRPAPYDPLPGFREAVRLDRLAAWFSSLPPPYAGYDGLERGLQTYRGIVAAGGWQTLPSGADLTLGSRGPRVIALRERLAIEDKDVVVTGDTFDAEMLASVQRMQRRYGLNPAGVVSVQTLAALNVPASERVQQIVANMERWRWLPQQLPKDRIQVNIAAAVLTVFDGNAPVQSMRAVTGRPGDETPMLSSAIHSIVINPPWNVPTSIATGELWPKQKKDPGYFKRNAIKVIDGTRLQQAAGDQSALGRFKFDFDNPYSVYLHDTPSRAKFASFSRLASHGCVRLEKPEDLAELLLRDDPAWSTDAIDAAVAKGDTVRARLTKPVAVYLLYWTAFASGNGQMNFRSDPYGWDMMLAAKIAARSARLTVAAR